ncbi:hypothetical protein DCS_02460 [Drechmeria coniospora]|uniref:Magnesium-dependent phosphatase-1 family protein n=1 Tax=Drechmeria coniospora TaxID=98403 RepID=A0A151GW41_DRECN|nr:hypothetical protein DCS_02460 [Drechmeria coniospora]KYK61318.1 hypothetical protein DCS_02460 [Drechmeria coniospora]ODA81082.1 hypothetical protein RJ55_04045 [Drechmeria coniospora]
MPLSKMNRPRSEMVQPSSEASRSASLIQGERKNYIPPSLLDPSRALPKLIVFDLDYTLWPFWVDTHISPPLKVAARNQAATDKFGERYAMYDDVPAILGLLASRRTVKLAVASRTSAPNLARDLLKMLHIGAEGERPRRAVDVFDGGMEIYPGSKMRHFEALQRRTGLPFEDMLFFDDEPRNMETEQLGVTMCLVRDGVSWREVARGVDEWRRRRGV